MIWHKGGDTPVQSYLTVRQTSAYVITFSETDRMLSGVKATGVLKKDSKLLDPVVHAEVHSCVFACQRVLAVSGPGNSLCPECLSCTSEAFKGKARETSEGVKAK